MSETGNDSFNDSRDSGISQLDQAFLFSSVNGENYSLMTNKGSESNISNESKKEDIVTSSFNIQRDAVYLPTEINIQLKHFRVSSQAVAVKIRTDNLIADQNQEVTQSKVSQSPIKAVSVLKKQYEDGEKNFNSLDVPRIIFTKATPEKSENKIKNVLHVPKKVVSPVAEYRKGNAFIVGKKIVFRE